MTKLGTTVIELSIYLSCCLCERALSKRTTRLLMRLDELAGFERGFIPKSFGVLVFHLVFVESINLRTLDS